MLNASPSGRIVTSLKVAALVTVLGSLVLAAEQHLGAQASTEQSVAAAPASGSMTDRAGQPIDYFPARFPAPSGAVVEQPPTF